MFSGLDRLKYSDIYSVVNDLKSLCTEINLKLILNYKIYFECQLPIYFK